MRTPLNAVVGITNLLRQTELTPEQKEYTDSLNVSSNHLLGIINDLLDLSKIEKGHIEFIETHIKIKDLTASIVESFKAQVEQKQLALNININDEIPTVILGDRKRLEQILLNLMGNAIKFTNSGEINIFVALRQIKNIWPNMNIDTATNGQEAIDKISQNRRYDVVLIDIQMPVMDGYEASRYIRDNMDKPANEIHIIALTAGLASKERLLAAGINDFLLKPFQQKDLINKIRGFVEHII